MEIIGLVVLVLNFRNKVKLLININNNNENFEIASNITFAIIGIGKTLQLNRDEGCGRN